MVDDRDRMETMLDAGVDAISINRPRLLNDTLSDRGLDMQHPENDAERESYVGSRWQLTAPDSAPLATRVPVSATFHDDTGNPVRGRGWRSRPTTRGRGTTSSIGPPAGMERSRRACGCGVTSR